MRIHSDQLAAGVIVALAAAAFGLTYRFAEVPAAIQQGMSPARYPQLIMIAIAGLCLALAVRAHGAPAAQGREPIDGVTIMVAASSAVFMALVWLVGMVAAMAMALLALGLLWGERRRLALALNAVLLPAVIWAIFARGLKVPLPAGLFGRMLGLS